MLLLKIQQAFGDRCIPNQVTDGNMPLTCEQTEAMFFRGRDWRDITWEEWESHCDAFYAFTPEAFQYYLPSIVSLAAKHPGRWFWPADALVHVLDRSPVVEYWDRFLTSRLLGLKPSEYEVLQEWILGLSGTPLIDSDETAGRAFDTLDLLKKETERVRRMIEFKGKSGT
jgi:hypothetical protein